MTHSRSESQTGAERTQTNAEFFRVSPRTVSVSQRLLRSNKIVDTLVVHALNDADLLFRVSTLGAA